MQNNKTVLDGIKLYNVRIAGREAQREELESLKKHITKETYNRVSRNIREAIKASTKEKGKIVAIIKAHPHELQRQILYYKWVQGMSLQEVAEKLNYSEGHILHEHAKAIKEINSQYPPD